MMDAIQKSLLHEVAELDALPVGAYNIRANGKSAARNTCYGQRFLHDRGFCKKTAVFFILYLKKSKKYCIQYNVL